MLNKIAVKTICLFATLSLLLLSSGTVAALTGTLSWEPGDSPSKIASYKVAYGQKSKNYTKVLEVQGTKTSAEISGLEPESIYFFAVKTVGKNGNESEYSNELAVYTPKARNKDQDQVQDRELLAMEWNESEYLENNPQAQKAVEKGTVASGFEYYLNKEYQKSTLKGVSSSSDTRLQDFAQKQPSGLVFGLGGYSLLKGWVAATDLKYNLQDVFQVSWPEYIRNAGETRISTGDIDADGEDEVIIGLASTESGKLIPAGQFEVLDHDYSHLAWGQVDWPSYNDINGETWPATGDLDGDGKAEILIGLGEQGQGFVEIFEFTEGKVVHQSWAQSTWKVYNQAHGEIKPSTGDLDGDQLPEILLGFSQSADSNQSPGGRIEILNGESFDNLAWGELNWPEYNSVNGEIVPGTGDLNGDGRDEILLGLGKHGLGRVGIMQYRDKSLSHLSWAEPLYAINDPGLSSLPVSADLDQDNAAEILASYDSSSSDWISYYDDQNEDFSFLQYVELWPEKYGISDGKIWPAIQFSRK